MGHKLNPNSVNDHGTKSKEKSEQTMNRRGFGAKASKGKLTNPMDIPTTQGYVGRKIKK